MILVLLLFIAAILAFLLFRRLAGPLVLLAILAFAWNRLIAPTDIVNTKTVAEERSKITLPAKQITFCQIVDQNAATYEALRQKWSSETNPILKDRIIPQLDALRTARDTAVYDLLGRNAATINGWTLTISSISTNRLEVNGITGPWISIKANGYCDRNVSFSTEIQETQSVGDFFSAVNVGDNIKVSASLLSHDAALNTAPRALDWDGFEVTAMTAPSYRVNLIGYSRITANGS